MNTPFTGRNDRCPCGSGKKFKHCCLGKESSASSNPGTSSASEILRKALASRQFKSMEEAQAFVSRHAQAQNLQPREEFHGLSPEQMHKILNLPFTSPELVRLPEVPDIQPTAPILRLFSMLTAAIGVQGLKPTAKGNLPRNFCRETALAYWGEKTYQERIRFGGINREDDFHDLHVTRLVAELAGLIRKHNGKFILSHNCRQLLTENGLAAVYPKLFRAYVEQFNWAYRDGLAELRFIQQAFGFTLYLLNRYGTTYRSQAFYEDAFLRAFPTALEDVPPSPVFTPEEELRDCYTWRTLVDFARFLGLAEVEKISDDILHREYRVKALPLLREAVQFQI